MKPSLLKAMAPSEAHINVLLAMLHSNPSNGEGEPHTPSQQTPPSGGLPPCCLQAELGDLVNHKLHQLMDDLTQEIVQHEVHMPPSSPPPNTWVCPSGSRDPKEDDWEVTFPGGETWGPLRQPTPSTEPKQSAGGRVPSGPPLQVPHPAPSGSDMGATDYCPDIRFVLSVVMLPLVKQRYHSNNGNHKVQCIKDHYLELVV